MHSKVISKQHHGNKTLMFLVYSWDEKQRNLKAKEPEAILNALLPAP